MDPLLPRQRQGDGYVSRLADKMEAQQLADGLDVLERARRVLEDPPAPHVDVWYGAIRLTECLADALRTAKYRGRRLPPQPDGEGDDHHDTAPGDDPETPSRPVRSEAAPAPAVPLTGTPTTPLPHTTHPRPAELAGCRGVCGVRGTAGPRRTKPGRVAAGGDVLGSRGG